MAKIRTNFLEVLLKAYFIGKEMYDDTGKKIKIDDINYQPILDEVYIKSGSDGYKLTLNDNYDFELTFDDNDRIAPNKGKIKGQNKTK